MILSKEDEIEAYEEKLDTLDDSMNTFRKELNTELKILFQEPDFIGVKKVGSDFKAYFDMGKSRDFMAIIDNYNKSLRSQEQRYWTEWPYKEDEDNKKIPLSHRMILEEGSVLEFTQVEAPIDVGDVVEMMGEWIVTFKGDDIRKLSGQKPLIKLVDALCHNYFNFGQFDFTPKLKAPTDKADRFLKLEGTLLWIPFVDETKGYFKHNTKFFDLKFSSDKKDKKKVKQGHPMGGKIIITDFENNRIYFTTQAGALRVFPLIGAQQVLDRDIVECLEVKRYSDAFPFIRAIDPDLADDINTTWTHSNSVEGHKYGLDTFFTDMIDRIIKLFNDPANFDKVSNSHSIYKAYKTFGFLKAITKYSPEFKVLKEKVADEQNKKYELDIKQVPKIPIIKKDWDLLPHQGSTITTLKEQDNVPCDIDLGGGKWSLIVIDAILRLEEGNVKRPCVVVPELSIAQQVLETNKLTENRLNIIVVNTKTEKAWGKNDLRDLILDAPVNTLILTSYDWLARGGRWYDTGMKNKGEKVWKKYFSRADFLTKECKVDMVSFDEAHLAKNDSADRTAACKQLANDRVKVKRTFTGTTMPTRPSDIVNITGLVDSGIFKKTQILLMLHMGLLIKRVR